MALKIRRSAVPYAVIKHEMTVNFIDVETLLAREMLFKNDAPKTKKELHALIKDSGSFFCRSQNYYDDTLRPLLPAAEIILRGLDPSWYPWGHVYRDGSTNPG